MKTITREEIDFLINTLQNAIEWADYADDYFKEKHDLNSDIEDVKKSIKIIEALQAENEALIEELTTLQANVAVKDFQACKENRLGYTSFINDAEDMNKQYEWALDKGIDELDHFVIAIKDELGVSLETELAKTQAKLSEYENRRCDG